MKSLFVIGLGACALFPTLLPDAGAGGDEVAVQDPQDSDLAKMMAKAKRYIMPGKHHKVLERFLGTWQTETRIFAAGRAMPAEKGSAEIGWLMKGRWIKNAQQGTLMGKPVEGFTLMGYDNFKHSYVATSVTSFDTAMNRAEGDMDPGGKVMLLYGTIDEYLTGEVGKMVKVVWRFESSDKMIMELHDLPIGENNTKVVEVVYTRK